MTKQSLWDDLQTLYYLPGDVRRDIAVDVVRDRKRAETRAAATAALSAIEKAIALQAQREAQRREELSRIRSSRSGQVERLVTTFTAPWDG